MPKIRWQSYIHGIIKLNNIKIYHQPKKNCQGITIMNKGCTFVPLKNLKQRSSPGPDGVTYKMFHQLISLHKLLDTPYKKVLQYGTLPSTWAESIIKLIRKKGSAADPSSFCPIALSNTLAKTFHLII